MGKINMENLRTPSTEEARAMQLKSAQKRSENIKKRKSMKETLELFLSLPLDEGKEYDTEKLQSFASLKGKNITVNEAILIKQVQKALKGDNNAINFVRDLVEPKTNNLNITGELPVVIGGENDLKD